MTPAHRLRLWEYAVGITGLALGLRAMGTEGLPEWKLSLFFILVGIALLQTQVTLPSGISITPSLPLIMAGLLLHGMALTALIVIPGAALRIRTLRRPLSTAFFSAGQLVISAQLALMTHTVLSSRPGMTVGDILALATAILIFDLFNMVLVVLRAALDRQTSAWQLLMRTVVQDRSVVVIPYHLLTILTCLLYMDRGFLGLVAGLLCVLALKLLLNFQHTLSQTSQQIRLDHLTGAFNSRFISEWFAGAATLLAGHQRSCTVLFIDMDGLKSINDRYGHEVGDRALRHLADVLRASLRQTDCLCRYGGDEFIIICPDLDVGQARLVAQRMLQACQEQPLPHQDGPIMLPISIGSASYPEEHGHLDQGLIQVADQAMYLAKGRGGNQACIASELTHAQD